MNFLQISLTSKCNASCRYCPMAGTRNTDEPKYHLTNEVLIPYIKRNIDPKEWLIELTGGEPTLYDGISELLNWLSDNGYTVHLRTNGIIPVSPRPGLTRIVAFHDLNRPPEVFDVVLIVDRIQSAKKIKYCEEHHFKYEVIGFNDEVYGTDYHGFKLGAFIDPNCHQVGCKGDKIEIDLQDVGGRVVDMNRLEYAPFKPRILCEHCKVAVDAWRFYENCT